MKEKIINGLLLNTTIRVLLILSVTVSMAMAITSGIFAYKLNKGHYPTKTDMQQDHKILQDSVNTILRTLKKP
jgi:spore coat protein CotF